MPSETTTPRSLVARYASRVKDTLRFARSNATEPQTNEYVRQLAKDALSRDRSKCIEQVCALVIDAAQRGTLEEAEAIGLMLVAIARGEWHAAHPLPMSAVPQSVAEAHMAEEHAEGLVEEAETAWAHDPSVTNAMKLLAASAAHIRARRVLDDLVRAQVVAA